MNNWPKSEFKKFRNEWYIERKIENKRKNHFRNEDSQNRSVTKVNKHNEKNASRNRWKEWNVWKSKLNEEGGGNGELWLNGWRISVWEDEKVLEIAVMVAQHCECV